MRRESTLLLFVVAPVVIIPILFMWQRINIPIPNASAVTAVDGIGVYWDQAATNSCQSISWGQLSPGSKKTIVVYLKNEGNESLYYMITTQQWSPINASRYIVLKSNFDESKANPGSVRLASLTLSVSAVIHGVVDFSFNIVVRGSPHLWADINHDGRVDGKDITLIAKAFGSFPGDPDWNPDADVNGDERVDGKDLIIAAKSFGETSV